MRLLPWADTSPSPASSPTRQPKTFAQLPQLCRWTASLVETDSPYLAPVPYRGKPNEPAYVVKTLETLAQVKGVSVADMAAITSDNFFRLFSKAPRPPQFVRAA